MRSVFLTGTTQAVNSAPGCKELHNDDNYLAFLWYFHVMNVF